MFLIKTQKVLQMKKAFHWKIFVLSRRKVVQEKLRLGKAAAKPETVKRDEILIKKDVKRN